MVKQWEIKRQKGKGKIELRREYIKIKGLFGILFQTHIFTF